MRVVAPVTRPALGGLHTLVIDDRADPSRVRSPIIFLNLRLNVLLMEKLTLWLSAQVVAVAAPDQHIQ